MITVHTQHVKISIHLLLFISQLGCRLNSRCKLFKLGIGKVGHQRQNFLKHTETQTETSHVIQGAPNHKTHKYPYIPTHIYSGWPKTRVSESVEFYISLDT